MVSDTEDGIVSTPGQAGDGSESVDVSALVGRTGFGGNDELHEIHDELESRIATGHATDHVLTYRDRIASNFFTERPAYTLAWPSTWYIPSEADHRQYWLTEPPPDHRFRYTWRNTTNPGNEASEKTGKLFAWNNVSGLTAPHVAWAGTAAHYTPTATLSTVKVGAEVDLVTEWRWWYFPDTGTAGYSRFAYRSTAVLVAFEISATGQWELRTPVGTRSLVQAETTGQGGQAVTTRRHAFDDLSVRLQLQGGRSYAIGVSFDTEITFTCLDRQGRPYQKQPGDDIRTWSSVNGHVRAITIEPETIWIP